MPQLRILHIALCLSAALLTLALGSMRSFGPTVDLAISPMVIWVLLGLAAMAILGAASIRTTIEPARGDEPIEAWVERWRTKCVVVWATLEGAAALCGVALLLGANPWSAGALAAGGLGFLASQSPGTLAGH
ncbi:MAG: hypothetical protein ABJB33_01270 [Gemmatimonadota bacterium]